MIIRPKLRAGFVLLPNALLNDKRLSADTRAMIAVLFSKPRGWKLRPQPLRKLLSRDGDKEVGWTKLKRMFSEAMAAGYMARSQNQQHEDDGTWGKYEYVVGMPEDVRRAVREASFQVAPCSCDPHEDEPRTQDDFTNHKEQSSERTESINSTPSSSLLPTLGRGPKRPSSEGGKRCARTRIERPEVIQQRIAVRLGDGDAAHGWLLLGMLPPSRLDSLTAMERAGHLGNDHIEEARAVAELAQSSAGGAR